jgi:ComF family protein
VIKAITHLFFPKVCFACGKPISSKLDHICIACRHALPRTSAHTMAENPIERIFWGRLPLEKATSFLKFQKKGRVQHLIHHFKYKRKKEIGETLGALAASELEQDNFFEGIDYLIPVPIHKLKLKKRGFNQSHHIAMGVEETTKIEARYDIIDKVTNTQSQTRKGRFKRWKNVESTFKLKNTENLEGKHLLLIDDVLTTGSTLEACGRELLKIPKLKLSLLTIAYTY